ncbi:hypothetical protein [Pseudomaricurvus sp. HS19]|uniref:hypothetical protein n=1 Tax=Pseudomaricurvus sp. HS19 TaxID=2692626 RepID=UPI001367DAF1|nr:hypothetical protein [Pseudomaricurvus sp. HS19]MYM64063.1 hypothetical protein [Pseudomaricurvus sp. HS19]
MGTGLPSRSARLCRRIVPVIISVALAVGVYSLAKAEATDTAAGDWQLVLHAPGDPREMLGHFEVQGAMLSGYLESDEGRTDFTGEVQGNQLIFSVPVRKPIRITLKYHLQVDGDQINGRCKMGWFGTSDVTGQRQVTQEVAQEPQQTQQQ